MTGIATGKPDRHTGPILVFDSGLGGLTVFRHIVEQRPDDQFVYVVDNEGFPYGDWEEVALTERIVALIGKIIEKTHPRVIVIACNTASTIAIDALRRTYTDAGPRIPIIGTVPAIKVAAKVSASRVFSVLATPGTVHRDYTRALISDFAGDCEVKLVGVDKLAAIAEDKMYGRKVDLAKLSKLIRPAFVEIQGRRTDNIVLGCTHYPLIEAELVKASPWPVRFIDPGAAIARRLSDVLREMKLEKPSVKMRKILFTKQVDEHAVQSILDEYGFEN